MGRRSTPFHPVVLFLVVAAPFLVRPELVGGDEPHYAAMAASIAFDGDFDLQNQYSEVARGESAAAGRRFVGLELEPHLLAKPAGPVFSHPLGLPMLAVPALWLGRAVGLSGYPDLALVLLTILASALALGELAWLLGRWLESPREGVLLSLLVWLGTPLWFYGRTFFTEPFLAALLVGACSLLVRGRPMLAGVLLGAAFLVKEAALLPIVALLVGTFWLAGARPALRTAATAAFAAPLFVARNLWLYGSGPIDFPQPFQRGDLIAGLAGLTFDRAHGLLPFAPIAGAAALGWLLARPGLERRLAALAALVVLPWLVLCASWVDWRGGACFGPRLLVPVLPALAVPLAILWRRTRPLSWQRDAILALAALGAGVEAGAIASPFRAFWSLPVDQIVARSASAALVALAGAVAFFLLTRFFLLSRRFAGAPVPAD